MKASDLLSLKQALSPFESQPRLVDLGSKLASKTFFFVCCLWFLVVFKGWDFYFVSRRICVEGIQECERDWVF